MRRPWPVTPTWRAQPLVACGEERGDGTVWGERGAPFVVFDEVVQLHEVDRVDAHAFEAAFETGPGFGAGAVACLGGQEDLVAMVGEPWCKPILRGAVGGGGVDVVDAPTAHDVERGVGSVLAHPTERSGSEDQSATAVAGSAEGGGGKHGDDANRVLRQLPERPLAPGVTLR